MKRICLISATFLLSCGTHKSAPQPVASPVPPPTPVGVNANLTELEFEFHPSDRSIVISGGQLRSEIGNSYKEIAPFYFTGHLGNGLLLSEPARAQKQLLATCDTPNCTRFHFELPQLEREERLRIFVEQMKIDKIIPAANVQPPKILPQSAGPLSGELDPSLEQMWNRVLASEILLDNSSLLIAKIGNKEFWGLTIGTNTPVLNISPEFQSHEFFTLAQGKDKKLSGKSLFGDRGAEYRVISGYLAGSISLHSGRMDINVENGAATIFFSSYHE